MNWIEANPLPLECENCQEEECYNCDYAMKRWYLSEDDEQRMLLITSRLRTGKKCQLNVDEMCQVDLHNT